MREHGIFRQKRVQEKSMSLGSRARQWPGLKDPYNGKKFRFYFIGDEN